jgi:hypothetical protein
MTWLDRVRRKNFTPYGSGSDKNAKSAEGDQKNLIPLPHGSDTSAKSHESTTSVTFVTASGEGCEVFAEPLPRAPEVVRVTYQRIFFDWAIADGTYTPQQLRKAKVVVKAWGPVQTCVMTSEGEGHAIGDQPRRADRNGG